MELNYASTLRSQDLFEACENDRLEIVRYLFDNEVFKYQALEWAAAKGHLDVVQFLLEVGQPSVENIIDTRALLSAAQNGYLEVVRCFLEYGADPKDKEIEPVYRAAICGYTEIVKLLTDGKFPVSRERMVYFDKDIVIYTATFEGHTEIVEFLLERGFDINTIRNHWSLLHEAVYGGHLQMVKLILSKNPRVDRKLTLEFAKETLVRDTQAKMVF
jgi:ankyrin repeat protein